MAQCSPVSHPISNATSSLGSGVDLRQPDLPISNVERATGPQPDLVQPANLHEVEPLLQGHTCRIRQGDAADRTMPPERAQSLEPLAVEPGPDAVAPRHRDSDCRGPPFAPRSAPRCARSACSPVPERHSSPRPPLYRRRGFVMGAAFSGYPGESSLQPVSAPCSARPGTQSAPIRAGAVRRRAHAGAAAPAPCGATP